MKQFLLSLFATAPTVFAADGTGNWKATAEGPNGSMERTFTLQADGAKLTGETVSSVKFQDNEMKLNYKGKVVSKDEIKFTVDLNGNTIEWLAKRQ